MIFLFVSFVISLLIFIIFHMLEQNISEKCLLRKLFIFHEKKPIFFITIISLFLFFIINVIHYENNTERVYQKTKERIYSFNSTDSNNINFIVGNSVIKNTDFYSIFILNDNNSKRKELIPSKYTDIYEEKDINNENAYLIKYKCQYAVKFSYLLGIPRRDFGSCSYKEKYELFVPEKTIINTFKID